MIFHPEAFHIFSLILRFPGLREKDVWKRLNVLDGKGWLYWLISRELVQRTCLQGQHYLSVKLRQAINMMYRQLFVMRETVQLRKKETRFVDRALDMLK